jgi:hypothetical protein
MKKHKESLKERRCSKVKKSKKLLTGLLSTAVLVSCVTAIPSSASAYNMSDLGLLSTAQNWYTPGGNATQRLLNFGYNANLTVDGIFGPLTANAVKDYQRLKGLSVDGMVGTQTWTSFYNNIYYVASVTGCNVYSAQSQSSAKTVFAREYKNGTYVWYNAYYTSNGAYFIDAMPSTGIIT